MQNRWKFSTFYFSFNNPLKLYLWMKKYNSYGLEVGGLWTGSGPWARSLKLPILDLSLINRSSRLIIHSSYIYL